MAAVSTHNFPGLYSQKLPVSRLKQKLHRCMNVPLFSLGKIQNLLPSGSVDSLTRLVLINALYFKGNWATKFEAEATRQRPFRVNMVWQYTALFPTLQVKKPEICGGRGGGGRNPVIL